MKTLGWSWLIGLCLVSTYINFGMAAEHKTVSLYESRVGVVDQSAQSRTHALPIGMHAVLVKVTGRLAFKNPKILAAMRESKRYLSEYSYKSVAMEEEHLTPGRYWLNLRFTESLVNRLVQEAELPVWEKHRKPILVWLIVEKEHNRRRVSDQGQQIIKASVEHRADQRGLPVIFPSMDLKDALALPDEDLWGLFKDSITKASRRYRTDQILAGRIRELSNGRFQGNWLFMSGEGVKRLNTEGQDEQVTAINAIDQITGDLAMRYAVLPTAGDLQRIHVQIDDLISPDRLSASEQYLNNLTAVSRVRIKQVQGSSVVFYVILNVPFDRFERLLASGPYQQQAFDASSDLQADLRFQFASDN